MKFSRREVLRTSLVLGTGLSLGLTGCGGSGGDGSAKTASRFAVLSDPHVYDTSLGTSGSAFEDYLAHDRKMLAESVEIMEAMVDEIIAAGVDFVLICGDLTKDGEKVSHLKMVSMLNRFIGAGIGVYVIPGNHDINNPHAMSFNGSSSSSVDSVTPSVFENIYEDCGYSKCIARDPNSLSYIAEPVIGVWLFAIDSCKYDNNTTSPDTTGEIGAETLTWILGYMAKAQARGKKVMGMMHHGIIPHFAAQTTFFPEYVVDEYLTVGGALANAGLKIMFTGHFHAQDIIKSTYSNGFLYDVETGSGVTAPSPYRVIDLDIVTETYDIASYEIHSIPSKADFDTYKEDFVEQGMLELYTDILPSYGIDPAVAPAAAEIHVAHYKGDEPGYTSMSATTQGIITALLGGGAGEVALAYALIDFAKDNMATTLVADNNITLSL
ncbi:MAG: metallophosphoesterase [Deferribacterales bacterium]